MPNPKIIPATNALIPHPILGPTRCQPPRLAVHYEKFQPSMIWEGGPHMLRGATRWSPLPVVS